LLPSEILDALPVGGKKAGYFLILFGVIFFFAGGRTRAA
jgi:hypothetical protein